MLPLVNNKILIVDLINEYFLLLKFEDIIEYNTILILILFVIRSCSMYTFLYISFLQGRILLHKIQQNMINRNT